MSETTVVEALLKRDRLVVGAALTAITVLCWIYLFWMAAGMASMDMGMDMSGDGAMATDMPEGDAMAMGMSGDGVMPMDMPKGDAVATDMAMAGGMSMMQIPEWNVGYFAMMFTMWAIMMVGMMVPSAAPMVLLFATVNRKEKEQQRPYVATGVFLTGYLLVWTGFSLAATFLQWGLDEAALLSPMMVSTSPILGGGLLIGAGVYQMTPWKNACLKHCKSPMQFVMQHWRKGTGGALRMGLEHGVFCMGCCWLLMGLLFFGGVMNLVWIAAIAGFVLLEKVMPVGVWAGRLSGAGMIVVGLAVLVRG